MVNKRFKEVLYDHKDKLEQLADLLFEKEVIFKDDMEQIFGERPFKKPEMVKPKHKLNGKAKAKPKAKTAAKK